MQAAVTVLILTSEPVLITNVSLCLKSYPILLPHPLELKISSLVLLVPNKAQTFK